MTASRDVVIHVSDAPAGVARAIGSASTLHRFHPDAQIRIIVNGPAITGVTRDAEELRLPAFATVEACEVGMRAHALEPAALQPGILTTPSAIAALSDAQWAGAAYIRI
ncbi:hypothetical protein ACFU0W_12920 [Microbacterium keratanolyticum]|uniref:DsrE family protein n=1 Tax=Microbacterium keratanolyticum TaxID=67574 RepID=UPI0036441192